MNVYTMPFEPKCPPATLEKARKWLRDETPNFYEIANFCIFSVEQQRPKKDHWCHQQMMDYYISNRECVSTEIGVNRICKDKAALAVFPDLSPSLYRPFVDWFVNKSFASRFILNNDDFEECFNYGIVVSSDIPTELMQSILVPSRYIVENNPNAFILFNRLLSEGYPGSVAFALSFHTNVSSWSRTANMENQPEKSTLDDDQIMYGYGSHRAWGCWSDPKSFKTFGRGEFNEPQQSKGKGNYRDFATIYGSKALMPDHQNTMFTSVLIHNQDFRDGLKAIRGENTVVNKIINPFQKKKNPYADTNKAEHDVTVREMLSYVLPYLKSKGYFEDVLS